MLEEAGKLTSEVAAPLNVVGDTEGCVLENGVVRTPTGFKDAFDQVREGGWTGLDLPEEYRRPGHALRHGHRRGRDVLGRQSGLHHVSGPDPRRGLGDPRAWHRRSRKTTYLPKMVTCDWTGTMNLTEPHCGTDLGLMRTKAEPQDDGSYKITGQKIFISAGEHDMADNIIHLVLAKIAGGPEGIKGCRCSSCRSSWSTTTAPLASATASPVGKHRRKDGHPRQLDLRDEL